jgi:dihydrofolate synthase/folylpolyglutamate synthase
MAFHYFAEQKIDVAVIEVGLGGRLDCTNIISPDITIITNISFDHVGFLGDTLAKIAHEKAGIIKPHTPVVIGEHNEETYPVFKTEAEAKQATIIFAREQHLFRSIERKINYDIYQTIPFGELSVELRGYCQEKNVNTILHAIKELQRVGYNISKEAVHKGFSQVCRLTGLKGRWQQLSHTPRLVCDTGHNIGGFQYIVPQILAQPCKQLRIVFGMVNDKDINTVLSILPKHATYYFTQASVARALPCNELQNLATQHCLYGTTYSTVAEATLASLNEADKEDFIYVGGSSFIVADLLTVWKEID